MIETPAFLFSGTLRLRPVRLADLLQLATWRNSPELRERTREVAPLTLEHQERWFKKISSADTRDFMFVVEVDEPAPAHTSTTMTRMMIGLVGLCHWSPRDRTAEVSFYIGSVEHRGKGHARQALKLLHAWGFESLGLDRIWAEVYAFNEPSIKLLMSLGYVEEGRLRGHVWRRGQRQDSIMLGMLREEAR